MKLLIVILLVVYTHAMYTHRVELSIRCTTPDGFQGSCIHLHACKQLQAINNRPMIQVTLYDFMLLTQSKCKARNKDLYCCAYTRRRLTPMTPMQCYTADGQYGACSRINSCPALNMKLNEPVDNANLRFINNLSCNSDEYSVCCLQKPNWVIGPTNSEPYAENIKAPKPKCSLTSLPPHPESDCCGYQAADDDKIIGGEATSIDQYPWLALIEYEDIATKSLDQLCGGSLISGRYVLTASHCFSERVLSNFQPVNVRLGEYDTSNAGPDCTYAPGGGEDCTDGPRTIAIQEIILHESYNSMDNSRNHDIALIRLSETAPYTDFIRPICLPTMDVTLYPEPGLKLWVSGWGVIENTHEIRSNVKRDVELPYKSRSACQQIFTAINVTISNRHLCAGGEVGKDACSGDSGGPLMHKNNYRYDVTGVVSFGPKPCAVRQGIPSVYTNVYEYLPWIRSNMRV